MLTTAVVFMVGVLFNIPVTHRQGMLAFYETESLSDPAALSTSLPKQRISLFYPSPLQTKLFVVVVVCVQVLGYMGTGMVSALLYNRGQFAPSKSMLYKRHILMIILIAFIPAVCLYYGYKFTRMLSANILMAEALLETPPPKLSIRYIWSMSPARYLCFMSVIFGLAMGLAAISAITVVGYYVAHRDEILTAENSSGTHFLALAWTCSPLILFVGMFLMVHLQLVRYKDATFQQQLQQHQHQQQQQPPWASSRSASPCFSSGGQTALISSRSAEMACYGGFDFERKMAEMEQRLQQLQEVKPALHRS
ncbi:hypothetical protein BGZ72_007493 [Mortierella alpina]|nr:hypothetical protein BGZ72_007493 [Mortierella alpina]